MMSNERLLGLLATLEQCRAVALAAGELDLAHLLSIAVLDIRMHLHGISDAELKALCDEMLADDGSARLRDPRITPGRARRPLLRLV
jgi:hypothetical protein